MAVSSQAVANEFIALAEREGKALTNMQLQKLVFIAQGFALAILDRPIYYHNTHAWQWGPVIPKLYKSLQKYGRGLVQEPLEAPDTVADDDEKEIIDAVWEGYGGLTGSQLSSLTHRDGTPWSLAWEEKKFGEIPHERIAEHYRQLLEAA